MDRILFYGVLALIFLAKESHHTHYPTIFWTPTNCKFKLNKFPAKGYSINVKYMSNIIFMCPHISIWGDVSNMMPDRRMMHENVLLVDKDSYDTCTIKKGAKVKKLLICDEDPMSKEVKYSLETIAKNQADPEKQCYEEGQNYYFISTASGSMESLNNTEGGHCKTHHMKLHIHVCNNTEPCEFVMPECPRNKPEGQGNNITSTKSPKCNNDTVSSLRQTGVKGWFSDNRHNVIYAVLGLFILFLIVIIIWLVYSKRSSKDMQKNSVTDERERICI
ncbi:ephrin-B2-like [Dendronephthya gigantea]|uniref:ephrin-B2-like n=1 Tax=Dendronephthya gigantea TaxID=151771 RepID=UPI00106A6AD6|nr:ephrin-B2-like [Dendronephthya gigantea]